MPKKLQALKTGLPKARDAVEKNRAEALQTLELLTAHIKTYGATDANWGHAGSLGHAVEQLNDLAAFFNLKD